MVSVVVIPYQWCLFNESLQKILQAAWEKYVESEAVAPKTPPTFNFPLTVLPHPPYSDTNPPGTAIFALRAEQFSSGAGAELDRS